MIFLLAGIGLPTGELMPIDVCAPLNCLTTWSASAMPALSLAVVEPEPLVAFAAESLESEPQAVRPSASSRDAAATAAERRRPGGRGDACMSMGDPSST